MDFSWGWNILDGEQASLEAFFRLAPWVMMFLVPAITMRSFADEHRVGTLELLLTQPLTEIQVVLAKFLGSWAVSIAALLPTLSFIWVVGELGLPSWNLDLGAIWGSYVGLLVFSGALTAIGVAVSSMTKHALVAFLTASLFIVAAFFGFEALADFSWLGNLEYSFSQLGMKAHYDAMCFGLLDMGDVLYFSSWTVLALAVTWFALALRKGLVIKEVLVVGSFLGGSALLIAIVLNKNVSIDLTEDQRHSLSEGGKAICSQLEEDVIVTCYLTGDLPKEWRHLENEIGSFLEQLSRESGGRIQYQFVDIYDDDNDEESIGNKESCVCVCVCVCVCGITESRLDIYAA